MKSETKYGGIALSRENDLQILQTMKNEIIEIYNLNEKCQALSNECENLSNQVTTPKPFEFNRDPENSQEELKAEFDKQWVKNHENTGKYRLFFLILNTVVISVMSVLIISDICFKTGIIIGSQSVDALKSTVTDGAFAALIQVIFAALLIGIPWKLVKKG